LHNKAITIRHTTANDFPLPASIIHPRPICLAGATATGKSEVALLLAERLNGEIISVDSMQVYRGLDIGTAKPGIAEQLRVPHHLIDIVGLNESFNAAQFVRLADATVQEIQKRGRLPILCGGTGLYFKAFLEGLGEAPPSDAALRAQLEATPLTILLEELHRLDPATFAKIDWQNPRRVVRAVEVMRLTGKPFSTQRAPWSSLDAPETRPPADFFGLTREPEDLLARINVRVERMFKRGLVEEVKKLLLYGLAENLTAMQAIGYRQVVEHLRDVRSLHETIELVKIRTRQFAKRQATWFRRQARVKWINSEPKETAESIAGRILGDCS
jgi:tRNA dimethylallyltransferase